MLNSNKLGHLPAPEDTEQSYFARVHSCAQACSEQSIALPLSENARLALVRRYDINPVWVPVLFSNEGLRLWEAGCTWYKDIPQIQLHATFLQNDTLLRIYKRDEVLAHEYVHAVRAPLNSDRFEEHFAYMTSCDFATHTITKLRAFFGPLFHSTTESLVFVTSLSVLIMLFFMQTIAPSELMSFVTSIGAFLCLLQPGYYLVRLAVSWRKWFRCKRVLQSVTTSPLALMLRMTDDEILTCSKLAPNAITDWLLSQTSFRWSFLRRVYEDKTQRKDLESTP